MKTVGKRLLIFAVLSAVIFEARSDALVFMGIAAVLAVLISRWLPAPAPSRLRPLRLLAFVPYFLWHSIRGGVDVALRAFRGGRALQPGFVDYPLRIRDVTARVVFANSVSLMPGTFTAQLHADTLKIHTLDTRVVLLPRLRSLEQRVQDIFPETRE
ncbi:hypothetical protein BH23GEM9_BH23GEM9_32350 [soil metagenome]